MNFLDSNPSGLPTAEGFFLFLFAAKRCLYLSFLIFLINSVFVRYQHFIGTYCKLCIGINGT